MAQGKASMTAANPGIVADGDGVRFGVRAPDARKVWLCLFDDKGAVETDRLDMARAGDVWTLHVCGLRDGVRYGYRADGPFDPDQGLWFDPDKLLVDPRATRVDRAFAHHPALAAPRGQGADTADLMPKGIVELELPDVGVIEPFWRDDGLVYEINVRGFTRNHPSVAPHERGTLAGLRHPAVIAHLTKIGVTAVELMPVTAWIDERHLPPLGLSNAWGYNPVNFFALDPRLAPRGIADLRETVAALHAAGIGVILDLVYNHTGESDRHGPTLSLRGLDNRSAYRTLPGQPGALVNDAGTGNTVACDHPAMQALVLDSLRHFVLKAGVDGFRFDLAPILGRDANGFRPDHALLEAMVRDQVLGDRILIAEPWDIGPGGYQLGNFRAPFLEWNDRYRDDVRRFWRGDPHTLGALATRLSGSADIFEKDDLPVTRSVGFLAAHDGFTLADLVSHTAKHNLANGEDNRDGHNENHSWNNGVEGASDDPAVIAARRADLKALLSTLFATRGAIMLTAGDEFGRSQGGNNNAYAQDNALTWVDWAQRDLEIENHVALLAGLRRTFRALGNPAFLTGAPDGPTGLPDVAWLRCDGASMTPGDWDNPEAACLAMVLAIAPADRLPARRLAVLFNRGRVDVDFALPCSAGHHWLDALTGAALGAEPVVVAARSVRFLVEAPDQTDQARAT